MGVYMYNLGGNRDKIVRVASLDLQSILALFRSAFTVQPAVNISLIVLHRCKPHGRLRMDTGKKSHCYFIPSLALTCLIEKNKKDNDVDN